MSERKSFLVRLDPGLHAALQRGGRRRATHAKSSTYCGRGADEGHCVTTPLEVRAAIRGVTPAAATPPTRNEVVRVLLERLPGMGSGADAHHVPAACHGAFLEIDRSVADLGDHVGRNITEPSTQGIDHVGPRSPAHHLVAGDGGVNRVVPPGPSKAFEHDLEHVAREAASEGDANPRGPQRQHRLRCPGDWSHPRIITKVLPHPAREIGVNRSGAGDQIVTAVSLEQRADGNRLGKPSTPCTAPP